MDKGVVRTAVAVLRQRPALLAFPALSVAAVAAMAAAEWLPLRTLLRQADRNLPLGREQYAGFVLLFVSLSLITRYFTAALMHSVHALLSGSRPALRTSLLAVLRRLPTLTAWTVVGGTVGRLLKTAESTAGLSAVLDAVGFSWNLLTFFVLPVIVMERRGLLGSLRRSLFLGRRERGSWVRSVTGLIVTTSLVGMAGIAVLILAVETDNAAVMLAAAAAVALVVLLTGIVTSAASGIYRMVLYRRAAARNPA